MHRLCARAMAVVVAVMIASTAGGAATVWADAPPAGALSQLPGQAACLATTNSDAPPDGTCMLFRTSAASGSCINYLGNAAISPDGMEIGVSQAPPGSRCRGCGSCSVAGSTPTLTA